MKRRMNRIWIAWSLALLTALPLHAEDDALEKLRQEKAALEQQQAEIEQRLEEAEAAEERLEHVRELQEEAREELEETRAEIAEIQAEDLEAEDGDPWSMYRAAQIEHLQKLTAVLQQIADLKPEAALEQVQPLAAQAQTLREHWWQVGDAANRGIVQKAEMEKALQENTNPTMRATFEEFVKLLDEDRAERTQLFDSMQRINERARAIETLHAKFWKGPHLLPPMKAEVEVQLQAAPPAADQDAPAEEETDERTPEQEKTVF